MRFSKWKCTLWFWSLKNDKNRQPDISLKSQAVMLIEGSASYFVFCIFNWLPQVDLDWFLIFFFQMPCCRPGNMLQIRYNS